MHLTYKPFYTTMAATANVKYLTGLSAVRERAGLVLGAAQKGLLTNFEYNPKLMPDIADTVAGIISVSSSY